MTLHQLPAAVASFADDELSAAVLELFDLLDRKNRTIEILAERCATQSEILSRWAEKRHAARIAG